MSKISARLSLTVTTIHCFIIDFIPRLSICQHQQHLLKNSSWSGIVLLERDNQLFLILLPGSV